MVDSPFLRATSSIRSTLQPFLSLTRDTTFPQRTPAFDPHAARSSLKSCLPEVPTRLAPLGLPEDTVNGIIAILSTEGSQYQSLVESSRRRLLEQLSILTVSSNPAELPALVEAACEAFYNSIIHTGLESVHKHVHILSSEQDSGSEGSVVSAEDSEEEEDEDPEADQDEEDENTPMKPGEEVPPLDTKFLPIFEALHERGKVLTKPEKTYLVNMTGMTYRQITIWFQNRRRGELKEDVTMRTSSLRDGSVRSLDSSEVSEDEADIEQRLNSATDTTFDIRSWRLTSALATKDAHGISLPPSPTKLAFGVQAAIPGYETDDTDLSDSDDELGAPPGLRVPSLTGSVATLNSATTRSANSSQVSKSFGEPVVVGETSLGAGATLPRPVKSLPLSRRNSPPTPSQPAQPQAPAFSFNFTGATPTPPLQQFSNAPASASAPPSQFVTSNERGLAVEMGATSPLSASTLRSASPTAPPAPRFSTPPAPVTASSPSNSGSRQNSTSPSPPSSSPRPAVKPLPRRTGCAPRPRPPPRATPASAAPTSSARPSIVLPPASNPSLAATTLGALLRPSVAPPAISTDMQERLSAMAGRMGVGSGSGPVGRNGSVGTHQLNGPSSSTVVLQTSSFSFGSPQLPKMGPSGSAPPSNPEQHTLAFTGGSPMSS